ncbi:hypothetical protein BSZ35_11540 [Salinibacter sp. 10B]|uniref:hypothetical protein n=1 Tax=Salinibacter sp. 10B TaxID=1923971 RepID=UPI000CF4DC1E|nr:hypothetical protein [Salinibacter sp. 10B]PQJ35143.1 hypothetical protein BSZ35_11540 [Salinibacter sp. 10B]
MSSSDSSSGKTRTRTITDVPSTNGHSKYEEEILKVARAAAIVEVHARDAYDGPDTLVLRSMDGQAASDCTYWNELAVRDQEQSGDLIECAFTLSEHEGTAQTKEELKDRQYALTWRPTGAGGDEIVLFEHRPYQEAWNAEGDRSVAATMTTARFRECSALQLPSEGGDLDIDLPDMLKAEYEPLGTDESHAFPMPMPDSGEPVQRRSGEASADESSGEGASVPGAKPPETDPPPGDRWMAVYGMFTTQEQADPAPTLLGAYKATQAGTYKRADLSGETPSASGPAQSDVLLPAGHVGTEALALFTRLALGTPSSERFKQGEQLLKRGGIHREDLLYATTPLFFGEPVPGEVPMPTKTGPHPVDPEVSLRLQDRAAYVAASEEGPGLDVHLINPLWTAERRVQAAEAAHDHYQEWMETVGAAEGHAGLVGDLCYNPAHGRGYLSDHLASAVETEVDPGARGGEIGAEIETTVKDTYDLEGAWAPFGPDQVALNGGSAPGLRGKNHQLGQFNYGLRCKRAFLVWNRRRACRRASSLLGTPYVYQALLDLCSAPEATELGTRAVEWSVRLTLSGGRVPFSDNSPAALVEAAGEAEQTLSELTGTDLATVLLTAGKRAAAYKLALAMGPAVVADWTSGSGRLPTGLSELAHFYMRLTHGADGYADAAGAAGEMKLVPSGSKQAEVTVAKVKRGPEGDPTVRHKMTVSGEVKKRMKTSMEELKTSTIGSAAAGLRVLTGVASILSVADAARSDSFGVGDALNLGTLGLDVAALYDESPSYSAMMKGKVPTWLGPTLELLGPVADVTLGAWQFGQAATNTTIHGQAEADDPNPWGLAGAVLGTAGGIVLTVGTGGTALALGAAGIALGGGASLYADLSDTWEVEAADPLSDWLSTEDLWGRDRAATREPLFEAVRPDPSAEADLSSKTLGGRPLPTVLTEQAKAAAERAFYFPTRVGVRKPKGDGPPVGLQLEIAVGYLPSYGTLMVDATVVDPGTGEEEALRCAVHYVKTEVEFRYCVVPSGKGLALPDPETDLAGWIQEQKWSWASQEAMRLPGGETAEAPTLGVHVGDWPTGYSDRARRQAATYARRMHVEKQLWVETNLFEPLGITGKNKAKGRMQNRRRAERIGETVDPTAHWAGPEGLAPILQSGTFSVTGTVYFRPLRPFDPDPARPQDTELTAKEAIEFEYSKTSP